jgi:hypothetical protein
MATPQLSPGVLIREVDLTVGRADNVLDNIGAIAGPFAIGPVDEPIDVITEQELINVFGKPTNDNYEYWMSASSYLSYGGVLKVVRTDSVDLVNANARRVRTGEINSISISSGESGGISTYRVSGTYIIDNGNYTTSGIGTDLVLSVSIGQTGTASATLISGGSEFEESEIITISESEFESDQIGELELTVNSIYGIGGTSIVGQEDLKIKNFDDYEANYSDDIAGYIFSAKTPGSWANNLKVCVIDDKTDQIIDIGLAVSNVKVGYGVTLSLIDEPSLGVVQTETFTGYLKGIITDIGDQTIDVKIVSLVSTDGTETPVTYAQRNQLRSFRNNNEINIVDENENIVHTQLIGNTANSVLDWYDQQTLNLTNSVIYWKSIAPKPGTTQYALERNCRSDEIHVVVIDDTGLVTGIQGNLLEKHIGLSKATDAISAVNSPQKIWWKNYIAQYSNYLYVGDNPSDNSNGEKVSITGFSSGFIPLTISESLWNEPSQSKTFSALGNATYSLSGGVDYSSLGGLKASLGDLLNSYNLFSNRDEIAVDYLIMGPGLDSINESQIKANSIVSIANQRKDCIAVISPHRDSVVDLTNSNIQTNNIIEFFNGVSISSSYAVFDSGYKYTYDRFNNKFRYVPCNADVAGLMVRTSIVAYPWFSPAGQQRGVLNNAIKLAYNPNKAQRDRLYSLRINSIVNQPGIGVILFGDKTALGYASAFDRINVRKLFLTVEQALERSAQAQLFELNDQITRANFVNIVEPYLRDVQAKRGVYDFRVICDETNNTPDVIDNNEFRADIFLKPTKSINYVTLTFVATRTGVSFEEVTGRV